MTKPKKFELDVLLKRFGYDPELPEADRVVALYMCWLYGASTRALGGVIGRDKTTVTRLFKAYYGQDAANLAAKSLLISMAEDYPDDPEVERFICDNITTKEKIEGSTMVLYTSNYSGRVITKVKRQRKYQLHRSNHKMQMLTKNQCVDPLWQTLDRYNTSED